MTLTSAYGNRRKDVPTASFGTIFNEQVDREQTEDRHTLLDLEYGRPIGSARLTVRGSYDRFTYDGHYRFQATTSGSARSSHTTT